MVWQERSRRLLGEKNIDQINKAKILICGLGGVGSFIAEALARSGIGSLDILDFDKITPSNINRQLPATQETIGKYKTEIIAKHLLEINPKINIKIINSILKPENISDILLSNNYTYIADAIDDLPAKIALIKYAYFNKLPIISSMGAAFRLDPTHLKISDISKTHTCPLARKLRKMLKDQGIKSGITVVWSDELPIKPLLDGSGPASMIFVPASAGILIASYITTQIINEGPN